MSKATAIWASLGTDQGRCLSGSELIIFLEMGRTKSYNLFTFFSLYIAQAVPMSFSSGTAYVMRQDYSLTAIALIKLIKIPWIVSFYGLHWSIGIPREVMDYKRWIVVSEILYALIILVVALLRLDTTPLLVMGLIMLAFVMSATQDIAADACCCPLVQVIEGLLITYAVHGLICWKLWWVAVYYWFYLIDLDGNTCSLRWPCLY